MHQSSLQARIISHDPPQREEVNLPGSLKPLLLLPIFLPKSTRTSIVGYMNVQSVHRLLQGNLKYGLPIVAGRYSIYLAFENGLRMKDRLLDSYETRMVRFFQDNGVVLDAIRQGMCCPAHTPVGVKRSLTPSRYRVYLHIPVLKRAVGLVCCLKSVHTRAV